MPFPTLPHTRDSRRELDGGYLSDRAQDGTPYVRRLYASDKAGFDLVLGPLNATQLATLQAHYASEASTTFAYTWPETGDAYTCRYAGAVDVIAPQVGVLYIARVRLEAS